MAIILLSHGSVLCGAEQNLLRIAERLRQRTTEVVEAAFLNYTEPHFATAVERCITAGASAITVLPYFLIAGKFVSHDLPRYIDEEKRKHPHVQFTVAAPIGYHEALADAVLHCASRAKAPAEWRHADAQTEQFCRNDVRCPLNGTIECPSSVAAGVAQ